jgi:hypothetical protein
MEIADEEAPRFTIAGTCWAVIEGDLLIFRTPSSESYRPSAILPISLFPLADCLWRTRDLPRGILISEFFWVKAESDLVWGTWSPSLPSQHPPYWIGWEQVDKMKDWLKLHRGQAWNNGIRAVHEFIRRNDGTGP